jgi:hypothetical protein
MLDLNACRWTTQTMTAQMAVSIADAGLNPLALMAPSISSVPIGSERSRC